MKNTLKKIVNLKPKPAVPFEGFCANCDRPVKGFYCAHCGQSVKEMKRPLFFLLFESIGEFFSIDNRLLHTFLPLMFRPGFLTREFMLGRRKKYAQPFRIYLFITFFAFFILSVNHKPERDDSTQSDEVNNKDVASNMSESFAHAVFKDAELENVNSGVVISEVMKDSLIKEKNNFKSTIEEGINDLKGDAKLNALQELWKLNPALVLDTVFKKLSQVLFLVLPILALLMSILYIRRKYYFIEHLLLSLNFHSFVFVIIIIFDLLYVLHNDMINSYMYYLLWTIPIYFFMGMKYYFKQSWFKTFVKFIILGFFYNIILFAALIYSVVSVVE